MSKLTQVGCTLLLFSLSMWALPEPPDDHGKPPRVTLNENDTPLDRIVETTKKDIARKIAARKLEEAQQGRHDCADAELLPEDDDKPGKKAKACQVMQFKGSEKQKDPVQLLEDAHHNQVGKRVKTRTKLVVDNAGQLTGNASSRWDDLNQLKYNGRPPNLEFAGAPEHGLGAQAATMRVRNSLLPASAAINEDGDCVDTASGKRHGGWVLDADGSRIQNPDSCFDEGTTNLKKTLTLVEGGNGQCAHANGKLYTAEECSQLNFTTLEEKIDEDPADGLDNDGDGFVDEDGPNLNTGNSLCDQQGGEAVAGATGESCDFGKEVRRRAQEQFAKEQPRGKKKLFKIDDSTGQCDPNAEGEFACGEEPREIELEETMELSCPPGGIYQDDRCLIPPAGEQGKAALAYVRSAAGSDTVVDYAMMGFTFAPPVLKWGINEVERVCVFGWCFEIFALRFGYEFEVAAGLRLPVQVTISDIPTPRAIAEEEHTLTAALQPADFKVKDYVKFCNDWHLDKSWYIADCQDRFAFPEYFESMLPDWMFSSPDDRQGQEFVAQTTIFAGLQIRVFSIPVVNFAVDSGVNVPAMCTLYKLKNQLTGSPTELLDLLASFGTDLAKSKNLMSSLEANLTNCASFTTPWGYVDDNPDKPREFPFLTGSFEIPADCTREQIEGVVVGGSRKPMCTGLKVNIYGATLGLGLEFVPHASSDLIKSAASTSGDADHLAQNIAFHWGQANPTIGPVRFDNHDHDVVGDEAILQLNEFTYCLNQLSVDVNGKVELGGLLAFIGNVATVPLVKLTFGLPDCGLPIGQHPGTGPMTIRIPVANYALQVAVKPRLDDPKRVSDNVLKVTPGTPGIFEIWVKNEGSVSDVMDNFQYALSNRPQASGPYTFGIYPNTDFDCTDGQGHTFYGYPFDNVADNCYDGGGTVLPGRSEITADDSAAVWSATLGSTSVPSIEAHQWAAAPVLLTVSPYRHPLTKPGDYPVRITADSKTARELKLHDTDPANFSRLGAEAVAVMRIESFFQPELTVTPSDQAVKPRGSVTYTVEATNFGNDLDRFSMQSVFADSNTAGCSLTANGSDPGCAYRAQITRIDPLNWTNIAELSSFFPMENYFQPLAGHQETFRITAPSDWAGMQDTLYEFTLTATSTMDTAINKAKKEALARFKVLATKESMSRYVNLEVAQFLEQINVASAQGVAMRGIQPVMLHPVNMMTAKALEQILGGDPAGASKTLSSAIKVMEAVNRMVIGAGLAEPLASDWKARSAAILADLAAAQASMIPSR